MPKGNRQARTCSTALTSSRPPGNSMSMPTISMEQKALAVERGRVTWADQPGSETPVSVKPTMTM